MNAAQRPRVLILGGTSEGRKLAELLEQLRERVEVISSLAGRVRAPVLPPGQVRIGGFGGVDGLVRFLREERIDVVVDATHPFAAGMTANAAAACTTTGTPLLLLRRPGWIEQDGDDWRRVPSLAAAADLLPRVGRRALLTTGRQELAVFAGLDDMWFCVRSVDPPGPPTPRQMISILDRGPFTVDGELALMREHRIDVLVTKDSGGALTAAKLTAARTLGLPVVMVDRPPAPSGFPQLGSPGACAEWLVPSAFRTVE